MAKLFGFDITISKTKEKDKTESFVPQQNNDGAMIVGDGVNNSYAYTFDTAFDNEKELIEVYREMSNDPDVEWALDDIINESLNFEYDENPVDINLDNTELSDKVKESIKEEFDYILRLLNFNKNGDELFRQWYIDGRLYFHKIVNTAKLSEGIKELRYIDPISIKKVIEEDRKIKEGGIEVFTKGRTFYTYTNKHLDTLNSGNLKVLEIPEEAISYTHSGIYDSKKKIILSYLHKAIKPYNQLNMLEDATAIYKIARAPSRRVFYVDVGQLSKTNAESHMRSIMNSFKNKSTYDSTTGKIKTDGNTLSMLEDIWLPRRDGKATEVSTLDTANGFSEMDEVEYFKRKKFKALHVPLSRLQEGATFGLGRSNEVERDEVKFNKFVTKLRKKFSHMFIDILRTQLILKKIITEEDWDELKNTLTFNYNQDSYFAELKETEILTSRIDQAESIKDLVGRYYSDSYVRKNVLKQTDDEIKEIDKDNEQARKDGTLDNEEADE